MVQLALLGESEGDAERSVCPVELSVCPIGVI